jgi:hypothetical protein
MKEILSRLALFMLGAGVLTPAGAASAADARRPVVVELFTSQGCSSCPPADALLRDLSATRPDVLAQGFHVDYWDRLGWRDPYSLPQATARQAAYVGALGVDASYTPQMVVDGRWQFVGSDRASALDAIASAKAATADAPDLRLTRGQGGAVDVAIGQSAGAKPASVILVGFDSSATTAIGRGENAGLRQTEADLVRGIVNLGVWRGESQQLSASPPPGQNTAVLLQTADGRIVGAARLSP